MKRLILILISTLLAISTIGCSTSSENVEVEKPKPVKVMALENETYSVSLDYLGNVVAKETKKYSFKLPGKIAGILINEGDEISRGDVLAVLDTKNTTLAVEASHNTLKKAQSGFDFTNSTYKRIEALFEIGAIPRQEFDQSKMKLDLAEADLHNAQVDYQNKLNMLEDCKIISDVDGYVIKILNEESEMTAAGYPVIVVRSKEQTVKVGFSIEDVERIKLDMPVEVTVNERTSKGCVTNIAQVPDLQTRTFDVKITLEDNLFPLGAFASVSIEIGKEEGILIPITSVLSNGEDYVYIVDADNRVEKRPVLLGKIRGNTVIVTDLSPNERLVIEGMKKLKHGDLVKITD